MIVPADFDSSVSVFQQIHDNVRQFIRVGCQKIFAAENFRQSADPISRHRNFHTHGKRRYLPKAFFPYRRNEYRHFLIIFRQFFIGNISGKLEIGGCAFFGYLCAIGIEKFSAADNQHLSLRSFLDNLDKYTNGIHFQLVWIQAIHHADNIIRNRCFFSIEQSEIAARINHGGFFFPTCCKIFGIFADINKMIHPIADIGHHRGIDIFN